MFTKEEILKNGLVALFHQIAMTGAFEEQKKTKFKMILGHLNDQNSQNLILNL